MSYTFGVQSEKVLAEIHPDLQRLARELIKHVDFMVREGYRDNIEQQKAYDEKRSKAKPGQSKHNVQPSRAVHFMPSPMPPSDKALTERIDYTLFAGGVKMCAAMLGIPIRWGGDWNSDWRTGDNRFNDLAHFELEDQ